MRVERRASYTNSQRLVIMVYQRIKACVMIIVCSLPSAWGLPESSVHCVLVTLWFQAVVSRTDSCTTTRTCSWRQDLHARLKLKHKQCVARLPH